MLDIQTKNNMNYIRFIGDKKEFNYYINKIMSIDDKEWDFDEKCWKLNKKSLDQLLIYFKDLSVNNIKDYSDISKKEVKNYENIGSMLKLPPYDYQKEAIKFCLDSNTNGGNLLVLPCGSGKTVIGIGLYLEALQHGIIKGPGLIVVKASLKVQWAEEVKKFSDLKVNIVDTEKEYSSGIYSKIRYRERRLEKANQKDQKRMRKEIKKFKAESKKRFKTQFNDYDLYVLNYETLRDDMVSDALRDKKIDFIYGDEIQYIKNHNTVRSKALSSFADAKLRVGATATPVTKGPKDIYGIFGLLDPSLYPTWTSFQKEYIEMQHIYGRYQETGRFKNLTDLKEKIDPYMFVKTKEDVSEQLPNLMVMQKYCNLTPKQKEMTNSMLDEIEELNNKAFALKNKLRTSEAIESNSELAKIDGQIMAIQTFAQELANSEDLLRVSESDMAKQYITNSKSSKLDLLMDLIDEILGSEEKVAIFSKYQRMQDIIIDRINKSIKSKPEYKDLEIEQVYGALSSQERYDAVQKFSHTDNCNVLLLSEAGAEGINLSTCQYLIEFELSDSFSGQTQRHGRIERADSIHDTVFVYQLIAYDSYDEIAQKIIDKKEGYDYELIKKGNI